MDFKLNDSIVIGGFSAHLFSLPKIINYPVIGINDWVKNYPCDYWIALDTMCINNWVDYLKDKPISKLIRRPSSEEEQLLKIPDDFIQFDLQKDWRELGLNKEWDGNLGEVSTTATAAIHLAIKLGYKNIILWGVDFVGTGRADGSVYEEGFDWSVHVNGVNHFLREAAKLAKIYKVHPDSPLDAEYIDPNVLMGVN